jgi:anti-anti-sigma factor
LHPVTTSLTVSELEVVVAAAGTARTVTPVGDIDLASAQLVRAALSAAFAERVELLVLDLARTTFIDSTAIHMILDCQTRAQAEGVRFRVLPGPPQIQRVFELCGLANRINS